MATFTSRLRLTKPADGEEADIGEINNNFDAIDRHPGIFTCTSTTRPSNPFTGQHIFETDTNSQLIYDGDEWTAAHFPWRDLSMGSGWEVGSGWNAPAVQRRGNLVEFMTSYLSNTGIATLAVGTPYTVLTVPTGYRPERATMLGTFIGRARGNQITGYTRINADGTLQITPSTGGTIDNTGHSANHLIVAGGVWRCVQ